MTFESLPVVGQGARHIVVSSSPTTVYRIEKNEARNNFDECSAKLAYHERVVARLFGSFVPSQRIVSLGSLAVIETEYVRRGTVCVELKPKWRGEDSFVEIQKLRGYTKIFSPDGLWSRNKEEVEEALWSAFRCDKPYLRIHKGDDDPGEAIRRVACAIMQSKIFSVLETIGRVSQWANAIHCLPIAKKLLRQIDQIERTPSSTDVLDLDVKEYIAVGEALVASPDQDLADRWINSYLTGRMVRDVSLMFSFSSTPDCLGGDPICVGDMFCRLAVIDTEIKPRSKILTSS